MPHPKHLHPRRYVFRGHASGVSAHIRRPDERVLSVQPCSSLPVTGGRTQHRVGRTMLDKWVAFESANTSAHGDYVRAEDGVASTHGGQGLDSFEVETRVSAEVQGLSVLGRLHVTDLAIGIVSRNVGGKAEAPIRLEGNRITGVRLDDARLQITLAEDFYQAYPTMSGLAAAWNSLAADEKAMFLPLVAGEDVSSFPKAGGIVKCTLVKSIAWDGTPHPTAQIHGHVIEVPNFGKIYFGEMFLCAESRRITMLRCQLGSDDGGEVSAGDGEGTTGQPYPPTGG